MKNEGRRILLLMPVRSMVWRSGNFVGLGPADTFYTEDKKPRFRG